MLAIAGGPVAARASSETVDAAALLDRLVIPRQPGVLAPRDDCAGIPGGRPFREAVARAALARDGTALAALSSPTVQLGFGGDDGIAHLRRVAASRSGALWADLRDALELGCAIEADGSLVMPWLFAQDPAPIDGFDAMAVIGTRVALRAGASQLARVVRRLDWQFVALVPPDDGRGAFAKVRTADGVEGFVARAFLRSYLATRVTAERVGRDWRITAIVAGD